MSITDKLRRTILPASLVIGLGVLEITYPHALSGIDSLHTGYSRSKTGYFISLFLILLLIVTWNKIGGSILILLGIGAIGLCLRPQCEQPATQPPPEAEDENNSLKNKLATFTFSTGKNYVQRKLKKR